MTTHPRESSKNKSEADGTTSADGGAGEGRGAAQTTRRRVASRKPQRRSQAERRNASKTGLLRAALQLIAERGFRGTSFQAIAQRAGYSPSLVSHRFGSKEGLLAELVRRMLNRWGTERIAQLEDRTGADALRTIADAHRKVLENNPDAIRAMYMLMFESLIEAPELRKEFAALDVRLRAGNEKLLDAGIEQGTVRADIDVSANALLSLALLRGITLQWMVEPEAVDLPRIYAALEELLERGLKK